MKSDDTETSRGNSTTPADSRASATPTPGSVVQAKAKVQPPPRAQSEQK